MVKIKHTYDAQGNEVFASANTKSVHDENGHDLEYRLSPIKFSAIVDVPAESIKHEVTILEGLLVYNKKNNQFLWKVGEEYFDAHENENVGKAPITGRMYVDTTNNAWIGTKNGLVIEKNWDVVDLDLTKGVRGFVTYSGGISDSADYLYLRGIKLLKGETIRLKAAGDRTNVSMIAKDNGTDRFEPLKISDGSATKEYEYTAKGSMVVAISYNNTKTHICKIGSKVRENIYDVEYSIPEKIEGNNHKYGLIFEDDFSEEIRDVAIIDDGQTSSNTDYAYILRKVYKGERIKLRAAGLAGRSVMISKVIDKSAIRTFEALVMCTSDSVTDYTHEVKETMTIAVCYKNKKEHVCHIDSKVKESLLELDKSIEDTNNEIARGIDENNIEYGLKYEENFLNEVTGIGILSTGAITENAEFSYTKIKVLKGDEIKLKAAGYNRNLAMVSQVSGSSFIPLLKSIDSKVRDYSYKALDNITIAISYNNKLEHSCVVISNLKNSITNINDTISDFSNSIKTSIDDNNAKHGLVYNEDFSNEINGQFILASGKTTTNNDYSYINNIKVLKGDIIELTAAGFLKNVSMISRVNEDGTFLPLVLSINSVVRKYTHEAKDTMYIAVSYDNRVEHKLTIRSNIRKAVEKQEVYKFNISEAFGVGGLFDRIAVIGDSLASGQLEGGESGPQYGDNYGSSWLSFLAKKIGASGRTHYSNAGLTCKDWLQGTGFARINYKEKMLKDAAFNAYFIALGTNDAGGGYSLGSINDPVGTDSFTGYYKEIISNIKTHAPNAPIFCLSLYNRDMPNYTNRIKEITELSENSDTFFIDYINNAKYLKGDEMVTPIGSDHFSTYGYNYVASVIYKCLQEIVINNKEYFDYWGRFINGQQFNP